MNTKLYLILSATALTPFAATPAFAFGDDADAMLTSSQPEDVSVIADGDSYSLNDAHAYDNSGDIDSASPIADAVIADNIGIESVNATALLINASADGNILAAANSATTAAVQVAGASAPSKRSDSFTVLLNQDSFFGFYPSFNGLIPVSDTVDFSFYGILWTNSGFSSIAGTDNDLWTEFGVGANFHLADGKLQVKPQIGLTNGALLSGGVLDDDGVPTGTGGNFADGVVPSLTVNYSDDSFEAEFYGGYYAALRNRNDGAALDFLHTWVNAGYKVSDKFSGGVHYELLSNTRNTFPGGASAVVYQWLGPYVQFATDNGFFARFTAGPDIEAGSDGDFYKLSAGFSF